MAENKSGIGVIADIHGNHKALAGCLDYLLAAGVKSFLFLGDYLGEVVSPRKTMEMLYDLRDSYECIFIRGNKEEYWLDYHAGKQYDWQEQHSTTGALAYTYGTLREKDLEFFAAMKIAQEFRQKGLPSITICHGSPYRVNEKMQEEETATKRIMTESAGSLILHGHTHIQSQYSYQGKTAFNPGSVGLPLQSGGRSQFAALYGQNGTWTIEAISREYEVDEVIAELHESGLYQIAPYWTRTTEQVLRGREIGHHQILTTAMQLCQQAIGTCRWPDIPELYWQQAYAQYYTDGE